MSKKIRRSFLFAPGDKPEIMAKTARTNADVVVFDFEDAVPNSKKDAARENLRDICARVDFGRKEVCTRINGPETNYWLDDLVTAVDVGVDLIKLPMIERPAQLETVVNTVFQLTSDPPEFSFSIESPSGLFSGRDLASTSSRLSPVTGISFGVGDYARIIGSPGINPHVGQFLSQMVIGYAAIGDLDPFYTVHPDVNDLDGQEESARRGYELGYIGQVAIHPDQVGIINEVYTPDKTEVREAREMIKRYDDVETDSITVDGTFLDTAIIERYRAMVDRYECISSVQNDV